MMMPIAGVDLPPYSVHMPRGFACRQNERIRIQTGSIRARGFLAELCQLANGAKTFLSEKTGAAALGSRIDDLMTDTAALLVEVTECSRDIALFCEKIQEYKKVKLTRSH
jgi:hypothetical protein